MFGWLETRSDTPSALPAERTWPGAAPAAVPRGISLRIRAREIGITSLCRGLSTDCKQSRHARGDALWLGRPVLRPELGRTQPWRNGRPSSSNGGACPNCIGSPRPPLPSTQTTSHHRIPRPAPRSPVPAAVPQSRPGDGSLPGLLPPAPAVLTPPRPPSCPKYGHAARRVFSKNCSRAVAEMPGSTTVSDK